MSGGEIAPTSAYTHRGFEAQVLKGAYEERGREIGNAPDIAGQFEAQYARWLTSDAL